MATPMESFTTFGRRVSVGTSQRNNPIYYTASNRYKGFGYKFSKNENKTNKAGTSVRVICVQCKLLGGRSRNTVDTTTMMLKSDPDKGKHICMERGHGLPTTKVLMEQKMRSLNQLVKKHPNAITPQKGSEIIYNKVKECFEGHPQQSAILGKLKTNARKRMLYHANTSAPSESIPDKSVPDFDDEALNDALEAIASVAFKQELSAPDEENVYWLTKFSFLLVSREPLGLEPPNSA
uniref:Transcription factor n=2 Tax=Bursaphelenchus xylophilus TaxID=6326 RepID=A0A1I7SIG3_BURXY